MLIKYLKREKNEVEIEMDNSTVAELLRSYLAKDDNVSFVAWRKEHPFKNIIFKIKTEGKTVDKAIKDAISKISKELDSIESEIKKAK
ncbi:MAG: RpoL/Rpb11 RNA polymerase subunit family protein [Candidatus Pacearchaeota archaeon]